MGTGAQPPLWSRLAAVAAPALLIAGEWDTKFVTLNEKLAAAVPGARLRLIADAGHTVHLEQPEAFLAEVIGFLEGLRENDGQCLAQPEENGKGQRRQ